MTEFSGGSSLPTEGLHFRGHHFVSLIEAERFGGQAVSHGLLGQLVEDRGDHTSATANPTLLERYGSTELPNYDAAYAVDVIGDTPKHIATYYRKHRLAYEQWTNATPGASITFDAKPDAICGSCVFGHHCKSPSAVDGDILSIAALRWVSEGLGLKDQVTISGDRRDALYKLVTTVKAAQVMMGLFIYANPDEPGRAFQKTCTTYTYEPFIEANANGGKYPAYKRPWEPEYYAHQMW